MRGISEDELESCKAFLMTQLTRSQKKRALGEKHHGNGKLARLARKAEAHPKDTT